MEALPLSKGATSLGGILGAGTGIYCGTRNSVYVKPEFRGKIGGKLVLAGKEIIEDNDSTSWDKVSIRYTSYLSFKKISLKIEGLEISTGGSKFREWCSKELLKDENVGSYDKAKKWCTKHETMEDHLSYEKMDVDLTTKTKESYQTLIDALSSSAEDKAFLSEYSSDEKKQAGVLMWCNKKSDADYEEVNFTYSIFKKICGKPEKPRQGNSAQS